MQEKYKKFKEFDFAASQEWQIYYSNLFPTPTPNKILLYKKKFYRNKIDPDFDPKYIDPSEQEQNTSNTNTNTNTTNNANNTYNNYQNNYNGNDPVFQNYHNAKAFCNPINNAFLKNLEMILLFAFFGSYIFQYKLKVISLSLFALRAIEQVGIPKFNMTYLQALVMNDSFHLLTIVFQNLMEKPSYFMFFVPFIHGFLIFCDEIGVLITSGVVGKFIKFMNDNKEQIKQDLGYCEIAIGFLVIPGAFLKLNYFLTPMVYWQMMRVRYQLNPFVHKGFGDLNIRVNQFKEGGSCPGPLKFVIEKVQWVFNKFGNVEKAESQGMGSCSIF